MAPRPFRLLTAGLSRVAPRLAARAAESLFLRPMKHRPPEREIAWARDARETTIPTRLGSLRARIWGEGDRTALLVHGWAGRGTQLGAFAEPLAAAGFRVVAVDLPAHGDSPGRRTSLPEMAQALGSVLDHLGGVDAVVAHSLGAAAMTIALDSDPALLEPGAPGARRVGRLVYVAPAVNLREITELFGRMTGFSSEVMAEMRRRIAHRFDFAWRDLHGTTIAPRMRRPLLVIHDRDDHETDPEHGRSLADAWPGARFELTEGLGHRRILRHPGVVASCVDFVRGSGTELREADDLHRLEAA